MILPSSDCLQPAAEPDAYAAALDAISVQARRSAVHLLKRRARAFARWPMQMEALAPGLASARPERLIAVAEHLLENEWRSARRRFGFGGEVTALNAKAALLYGRLLRRAKVAR
ncbi:MAG: hypothetical protein ACLP8A_17020 [Methylovirgula sp.]